MLERTVLDDGALRYQAGKASFTIVRLRPGLLLAIGAGHDTGEFGDAVLQEFEREMKTCAPVEIFVDTSDVFNATQVVFERWASWLSTHRSNLKALNALTPSRFVHLTVSIAKLISGTGELVRLYTDPKPFEEAIARETGRTFSLAEVRKALRVDGA